MTAAPESTDKSTDNKSATQVTLVILGASGDLTKRLLLPGLGTLLAAEPDRKIELVGADRTELSQGEWQDLVRSALAEGGCPQDQINDVVSRTKYVQIDLLDINQLSAFIDNLSRPAVLYFALPPAITVRVVQELAQIGLPDDVRLGLEKPFGTDHVSATSLNKLLLSFAHESQLFRIDHFLGKANLLDILGFRFTNRIWRQVWSAEHIERIDIAFDENLALEGRANYYDKAGALVDMIQSHLLQVMALVTMEEPAAIDPIQLRDNIAHVLSDAHIWDDDVAQHTRRARYSAGEIDGRPVPAYQDEPGVDPKNDTETLAEITLAIDNERWTGVPITLRSGKALTHKSHSILVTFKPVAHVPRGLGKPGEATRPNQLMISLSPAALDLEINTNGAGDWKDLEATTLSAPLGIGRLLPYGQILANLLDGDATLSVRGDVAEESWRIIEPVLTSWRAGIPELDTYPAGTNGPADWPQPTIYVQPPA